MTFRLLDPIAALYGAGVSARLALYRFGFLRVASAGRPVLSVGNVAAGGTGKTPFVEWLAGELLARGHKPAILTRGYGRRSRGLVVVSDGAGKRASVDDAGDEASLLARALPTIPILAHERRASAAREAERLFPATTLHLLDDGFSHVALDRDADVVLLDATDPDAGGALLPAGRLREPLASLARADAIVVTKTEQADPARALDIARRYAPGVPVHLAGTEVTGIADASGDRVDPADLPPGTVVAVAGIAHPEAFWSTLARLGVEPTARLPFPDHAPYPPERIGGIERVCEETGASAVVTTAKDAVKLDGKLDRPLYTVRIRMRVADAGFVPALLARIAQRPS